jgi:membrane protein YdbS with pleckstrin-like domain
LLRKEVALNDETPYSKYSRFLAGSERVVYTCRRHPIVMWKAILVWVGTVVAVMFLAMHDGSHGPVDSVGGLVFLLVSVYLAGQIAEWWVANYVITNKRVIKVEGIVSRRISTIPLGKITDTSYRRDWLGRLLGYGDMVLDTPGQDKYLPMLYKLPNPDRVYQTIMSIAIGGGAPPPPPVKRRKPPSEEDTATITVKE